MIVSLLLAAAGDPSGPLPGPLERAFESRIASAIPREDGRALESLLAEERDLLPSILDRWCLAALSPEPGDREAIARIERVASAARLETPPPLRIPPERLPGWREALGRLREAGDDASLRALLPVFESLGDRRRVALVRTGLGRSLGATLDGREAKALLESARRAAEEPRDAPLLGHVLETEAQVLRDLELHEEAIEVSRRALPIHRRLGDRRAEAEDERGIAVAAGRLALNVKRSDPDAASAQWRESEAAFTRAAEIHGAIGEEALRARALRGRAGVRAHLGDHDKTRLDFQAALEVFGRLGDLHEADTTRIGFYESMKGVAPKEAFESLEVAARGFADRGVASRLAAQTFRSYAWTLEEGLDSEDSPPPDALRFLRLARAIDERRGNPALVAEDLEGEARVLYRAGDLAGCEEAARRSLALYREGGDRNGRSSGPLFTLGAAAFRKGLHEEARAHLEVSVERARDAGNPNYLRPALRWLASLYVWLRDLPAARACLEEASRLEGIDVDTLAGLAAIASEEGDEAEAARLLRETVEVARAQGLPFQVGRALANLAFHERHSRPDRARAHAGEARAAFGTEPGPSIRAYLALIEGEAALAAREYAAADRSFRVAVEACGEEDSRKLAAALCGSAEASLRLGKVEEGARSYGRAIEVFDAMRPPRLDEATRIALQERFERLPAVGVEAAIRLGDPALALAAAEDAQGRALAEALERGEARKADSLERVRALLPADGAFVCYAEGLDRLYAFVVRADRAQTFDLGPAAPVREVAAAFRRICAEGAAPSPQAVRAFAEGGSKVRDAIWTPLAGALAGCRGAILAPGAVLSGVPFEALPLEVPAGAATFAEVVWAIERFAFSYVPSARVLLSLSEVPANRGRGLLAIADPAYGTEDTVGRDGGTRGIAGLASRPASFEAGEGRNLEGLPFSRVEATAVAALLPESERTMRLGAEATLGALAPGGPLEQARFVLLSAHGRADDRERSACGLWLSPAAPGGAASFFPASALASRDLRADLVVLSSCSTNRGRLSEGEGVLSLAREFLRAGSRAVVASEWLVEDAATASLSIAFHEGVLRDGLGPAEALRRAKVRYLRDEKPLAAVALRGSPPPMTRTDFDRRHPFFWAPLLLFGSGR